MQYAYTRGAQSRHIWHILNLATDCTLCGESHEHGALLAALPKLGEAEFVCGFCTAADSEHELKRLACDMIEQCSKILNLLGHGPVDLSKLAASVSYLALDTARMQINTSQLKRELEQQQ